MKELDSGKYGNVSKEMNDLFDRRMASLQPFYKTLSKSASSYPVDDGHDTTKQSNIGDDLDELDNGNKRRDAAHQIIIIDSDEEPEDQIVAQVHQDDLLTESPANVLKVLLLGYS